jgi:hypothetical protein
MLSANVYLNLNYSLHSELIGFQNALIQQLAFPRMYYPSIETCKVIGRTVLQALQGSIILRSVPKIR